MRSLRGVYQMASDGLSFVMVVMDILVEMQLTFVVLLFNICFAD